MVQNRSLSETIFGSELRNSQRRFSRWTLIGFLQRESESSTPSGSDVQGSITRSPRTQTRPDLSPSVLDHGPCTAERTGRRSDRGSGRRTALREQRRPRARTQRAPLFKLLNRDPRITQVSEPSINTSSKRIVNVLRLIASSMSSPGSVGVWIALTVQRISEHPFLPISRTGRSAAFPTKPFKRDTTSFCTGSSPTAKIIAGTLGRLSSDGNPRFLPRFVASGGYARRGLAVR
jgi:hypothetical protein